jgi:hypothetical protein
MKLHIILHDLLGAALVETQPLKPRPLSLYRLLVADPGVVLCVADGIVRIGVRKVGPATTPGGPTRREIDFLIALQTESTSVAVARIIGIRIRVLQFNGDETRRTRELWHTRRSGSIV